MKKNFNQFWNEKLKIILLATFSFGLFAHAFAYFNLIYNHDSLMVVSTDALWQISLGRYLQPLYLQMRGVINAPWLLGVVSLIFLSLTLWFMLDIFKIKSVGFIIVMCGICTTNITLVCLNATYLYSVDIYMLALLLSVIALWLTQRFHGGFLFGAAFLAASMALYQSYLAVFVTLTILIAIENILNGNKIKLTLQQIIRSIFCAGIGAVLYQIGTNIALKMVNIQLTDGYNGMVNVWDFSEVSLPELLLQTYVYFFKYFVSINACQGRLAVIVNLLLFGITVIGIICYIYSQKVRFKEILFLIVICMCLPFGANLIFFISKGYVYELMIYSFCLTYFLPAIVFSVYEENKKAEDMVNKYSVRKIVGGGY